MKNKPDTENLIEELLNVDPSSKKEIAAIETKYSCSISITIEKHNALQYTDYYEVDFGIDELFYMEVENGINNGTVLRSAEWDYGTLTTTKTVEVLTDITLDESYYKNKPIERKKALALLNTNKTALFENYRKQQYDNYVTGDNSLMKMPPWMKNLKLAYVFSEVEVDKTFI